MLKLHRNSTKARTVPDKTVVERQIAETDWQIDALAYDLFGSASDEQDCGRSTEVIDQLSSGFPPGLERSEHD